MQKTLPILTLLALVAATGCAEHRVTGAGGGVRSISGPVSTPPPEQMEALAARQPSCSLAKTAPEWSEVQLRIAPATLLLPPSYSEDADPASASSSQTWTTPDSTALTIGASDGGQFYVGGDSSTVHVDQGTCAHRIGNRLSMVHRYLILDSDRSDTVYVATVDVPLREHLWIGAGVLSTNERGREEGLAAFASLRAH